VGWDDDVVDQGCLTYLKARATNKSGTKVKGHNGSLGENPGRASGAKSPEADDILLILR